MGIVRAYDAGWARLRVLYVRARRYYFVWFMSDSEMSLKEIILYAYLNNLRIILYFIYKFNYLFCRILYILYVRGYVMSDIFLMPTRENVRWWPFTTLLIFTLFDYLRGIKLNKSIKPNISHAFASWRPQRHYLIEFVMILLHTSNVWEAITVADVTTFMNKRSTCLWISYRTHSFSHQKSTMST